MSIEQLEKIRRFEMDAIISVIRQKAPKGARVLDIGAGTGWQARIVSDAGYEVEAIDMSTSAYVWDRVISIRDYDGRRIPFPDDSFDVVYSSNVLEHVAHAVPFQAEIKRVLKPDGVAVHVVPSGSWRFWSNFAHYPYKLGQGALRARGCGRPAHPTPANTVAGPSGGLSNIIRRTLIPQRDGEVGNALTEIYHFSRWRWSRLFRRNGWMIESRKSNRLFYTAYYLLGEGLSIPARSRLSRFFGGSCHVFVLRPASHSTASRRGKERRIRTYRSARRAPEQVDDGVDGNPCLTVHDRAAARIVDYRGAVGTVEFFSCGACQHPPPPCRVRNRRWMWP